MRGIRPMRLRPGASGPIVVSEIGMGAAPVATIRKSVSDPPADLGDDLPTSRVDARNFPPEMTVALACRASSCGSR